MGQMVDAASMLPLEWWQQHRGQIDAAVIYIGGRRSAANHTPEYSAQLAKLGFKRLGCYVGSQAYDVNASGDLLAMARIDVANANELQHAFGLDDCPVAWDFEEAVVTSKVAQYLDSVGVQWSKGVSPLRPLYSSLDLLEHYNWSASWSGLWKAQVPEPVEYRPNVTTAAPFLAWQYADDMQWDGQDVDVSCYDPVLFTFNGGHPGMNAKAVALMPTSTDKGYWIVDAEGEVYSYGDASFHGSLGGKSLAAPIYMAVPTRTDGGYWLLGEDGGVFAFGDAEYFGHPGA